VLQTPAKRVGVRRWPGLTDYQACWQAMKDFTEARTPQTADELWVVEHAPVYTLGQAGKPEHVLGDRRLTS
jgi:lipoyl(octanoyl) transferase